MIFYTQPKFTAVPWLIPHSETAAEMLHKDRQPNGGIADITYINNYIYITIYVYHTI
jgi:hypothetical protein